MYCPGCEQPDPQIEEVCHAYTTLAALTTIVDIGGCVSSVTLEEGEHEIQDTDDYIYRCVDCGEESDDPAHFLREEDDER